MIEEILKASDCVMMTHKINVKQWCVYFIRARSDAVLNN